jgi:enediyne biosynthesis protein E3
VSLLEALLCIRPEEVSLVRRGFHLPRQLARFGLERVGESFLRGYHAALADGAMDALASRLDSVEAEFRGFSYEGAAMALDLLDQITPWRRSRMQSFLAGPAEPHTYMAIVGIGWSMARLQLGFSRRFSNLDPLLRWLAIDGWGFHEGYFHWPRYVDGQPHPRKLEGYGTRAFDQGLGRSLWFVAGADPELIVDLVEGFPDFRRGDLWAGIGLACTYAGGADAQELSRLRQSAGSWWPHVAQGAVFAAKARSRAGNPTEHTDNACRLLADLSAVEAAALSDLMLHHAIEGPEPAYEVWRAHIRMHFSA